MNNKQKLLYKVNRQIFFNWYFKKQPKEQISAFIAPYLLGLVTKPASFSLEDILASVSVIPSDLVTDYKGTKATVTVDQVELTK